MRTVLIVTGLLALAACGGSKENVHEFDGQIYSGRARAVGKEAPGAFTVAIGPVSKGLTGAREAGRYEATKFCIGYIGTSDVDWQLGPDTPDDALQFDGDKLILRGTCVE
ncbi:hypothetical protein VK792_01970 [Mesobacterium sp. TK19101]|uniref:Lipoprotein n=1 Tax=Mesobacterium hydrothermale TaxID=3111907 RepID=A0ABU6HC63_9RHOB|nr:hypothetical protein [Mesobacterium sp. TK19101]MEC3860040.1 hypothetical protein [Mesobacterium sp. TK19101]